MRLRNMGSFKKPRVRKKGKFKVMVDTLPNKQFREAYGKHTQGVSRPLTKRSRIGEIQLKKGLTSVRRKKIISHEVGHAVSEKAELQKKISKAQIKQLRKVAREMAGRHRIDEQSGLSKRKLRQEQIQEGFAMLYERMHTGTEKEKKAIKERFTKLYKLLKETKRRLGVRVVRR